MGKKKHGSGDYAGFSRLASIILAIIPITSWILGLVTRLKQGRIVAFILRLVLGWNIIWICDLVLIIVTGRILSVVKC